MDTAKRLRIENRILKKRPSDQDIAEKCSRLRLTGVYEDMNRMLRGLHFERVRCRAEHEERSFI